PATLEEEVQIVRTRIEKIGKALQLPPEAAPLQEIQRLVTIFRELRSGKTEDGKTKLKSPTSTLSAAEASSVINNGQALATYFGKGIVQAEDVAAGLTGAVIKDPVQDKVVFQEYLETVVKQREGWGDLYKACKALL
ncbi:MAG: ATPase, partial [Saprospiraceae bacterium]